MATERRYSDLQFDAGSDTVAPKFYGTAIRYNSRTAIGDPKTYGFYEEIAQGAVKNPADLRFLVDHDSAKVVSRATAGTLRTTDTTEGFTVESDLDPELSYVRDLKANLRNGNISGMSFGFSVPDGGDEIRKQEDGSILRIVRSLNLVEVSAVTFPAYTATDASLRDSDAPLLAERRSAWEEEQKSLVTSPGTDRKAAFLARERNLRYLAARHGLPYERSKDDER